MYNVHMKAQEIFAIWPSTAELALEVGQKYDTVRKWKKFGRIPSSSWEAVIFAAAKRGHRIAVDDLLRSIAPRKRRTIEAQETA